MRLFKKKRPERRQSRPAGSTPISPLIFEPLEPRILLSADAVAGSVDGYDDNFAQSYMQASPDDLRGHLEFKLLHKLQSLGAADLSASHIALSQPSQWQIPSIDLDAFQSFVHDDATAPRIELIIVDSATPDAEGLLANIRTDTAVQYQVHFLDADRGGVEQVSEVLQTYGQVDALHVIGHGAAAAIQLGTDHLRSDNAAHYQTELQSWRGSLSADADILFYGCEIAANDAGRDLLTNIADWTGADVAASDDKTGATNLAADWQLEYRVGLIDTVMPFAGVVEAEWQHNLATIVVTSNQDTALPVGVDSVAELLATGDPITFRQAISVVDAEYHAGSTNVHTIAFDLQNNYNIVLTSPLHNLHAAVVIDGTTDPGFEGTPVVTLTGTPSLLVIDGDNITVRGLVLQGSGSHGITISGDNNVISGNIITANTGNGIYINGGEFNQIGGATAADRNVINSNAENGIFIRGASAEGNRILGNYIGVSVDGQSSNANQFSGIRVEQIDARADAANTVIGGLAIGEGNVISGNGRDGIYLGTQAYNIDILGNLIGLAADGEKALGNLGNGITVKTGVIPPFGQPPIASDVLIQGNSIAHNMLGVSVENIYTYDIKIVENLIFSNTGLGIDLVGDGVTANDAGDSDIGENARSNFPVINSVSVVAGQLRITGSLDNAQAIGPLEIHFYYATTPDVRGHGDAEVFIGSVTVTPDASGISTFDQTFAVEVPDGAYITATATGNLGTSEFAANVFLATGNLSNQAPTGEVTIAGSLVQGAMLTAANNLVDGNGRSGPLSYQWQRNGVAIAGATATTYTLTQADVGSDITVVASYTDDAGFEESVASAAYGPVININDAPSGDLTIIGDATQGQTLTVQNDLIDPDGNPTEFAYQWLRDGAAISGATGESYLLTQADVGAVISVTVSYEDGQGTTETLTSAATEPVLNINDAPTGALTIAGVATQGQTLTAQNTLVDSDGNPEEFSYQWLRNGVDIDGATAASYILTQADVGATISVVTRFEDGAGATETVTSDGLGPIENINDAPVGGVGFSGVLEQNQQLTADVAFTDADGVPAGLNYQWLRNGEAITGANSATYTLTQMDVGTRISLAVSYTDLEGTTETLVSALSNPVANVNDPPTGGIVITGSAVEGNTLNANQQFSDGDGLTGQFIYQWYRDGAAIQGADQLSYTLVQADVGTQVSVAVFYVDAQGAAESLTSQPTQVVSNINNAPTGAVQVVGELQVGETLAANPNIQDADGLSGGFAYQWYRDGAAISGATTATYQLQLADLGGRISVQVSYVDDYGAAESISSAPTAVIGHLNAPPAGSLLLNGLAAEDQTLTLTHAFTDADGLPATYAYQWYRDGVAVAGATGNSYQLGDADVGARIYAEVSYTDGYGTTEVVVSAPTQLVSGVNDAPVGTVSLSGAAVQGGVLNASNTVSDADGLPGTLNWQWYRNGAAIVGANADTYQLTDADVDARIHVRLSYVDQQGFSEAVDSAATGPVMAVNAPPAGQVVISGTPVLGGTLALTANLSDANGLSGAVTYLWQRDGELIEGATGTTYQLTAADSNTTLSVLATYTDDRGFEEMVLSNLLEIADLSVPEPEPEPEPPQMAAPLPDSAPTLEVNPAPAATQNTPVAAMPDTDPAETVEDMSAEEDSSAATADLIFSGGNPPKDPGASLFDGGGSPVDEGGFAMFSNESSRDIRDRLDGMTQSLAASVEKVLYSAPLQSVFPSLQESLALLNDARYSNELADAVQSLQDNRPTLTAAIVGGTAAVSTGLSVGYVIWTLRSGILLTGLLSSLPAWRFIDPLPILSGRVDADEDEDQESLESLVAETGQSQQRHGAP